MSVLMRLMALFLGFAIDIVVGDPQWMPHIIRLVGGLISALERILRALLPKSNGGELFGGFLLVVLATGIPSSILFVASRLCLRISPWAAFALETLMCYQLLATKALRDESMKVYYALRDGTIEEARYAVSMIVGRDTERLDVVGVTKATVETVAENASDGVIAPLIYLALGGSVLGLAYKCVNTMDSMVGYKNDRYMFFGRCAAYLDDILNFIPARFAGLLMCLCARLVGFDSTGAMRIFFRDRHNHKSPNSAHTEAACAGALGIQLAGSSYYFGELVSKPTIGDATRPVVPEDIIRANHLLYATAFTAVFLMCLLPIAVLYGSGT